MSNNTLLYQVIPMALPGLIGSQSSSLELRLALGAVGLMCLMFANVYALNSTTEKQFNFSSALLYFSRGSLGTAIQCALSLNHLESIDNAFHLCLYAVGGGIVIPLLSAYNGHGLKFAFDYIEPGPFRGHKLFWLCMSHFIGTRMITTLTSYLLSKRKGPLVTPSARKIFYTNACKGFLPLAYALPAYALFGFLPGENAGEAAKDVAMWFCGVNETAV